MLKCFYTSPLSALARARKQDGATALGGVQGQLVKGEDLAPAFEDAAPGAAAHTKSIYFQFGHLLDTNIITYSLYNHSSFALAARKLHLLDDPGKGQRFVRLLKNLFSTTWLKVELVRLARNLYSWTNSLG